MERTTRIFFPDYLIPTKPILIENSVTMIRDSRCIRPQKGLSLVSVEASGWYQVVFAAKVPPQVNTE